MIAVALVTAILTAFFVNRSSKELPVGSLGAGNTTSSNSTSPDLTYPTPIGGEETDDDFFITTAETPIVKDDDFISTIELPKLPQTEVTPRFDDSNNDTDTPLGDEDSKTLGEVIDQLPIKGRPSSNEVANDVIASGRSDTTDIPSNGPTLQPSLLPSDGPSLQNSIFPSDGPSLQNSIYPSDGPSLQNSIFPSDGPSIQNSIYPSDGPSLQNSIYPSDGPSLKNIAFPSDEPSLDDSMNFLIADFVEGLNDEDTVPKNDTSCPLTRDYFAACSDTMVGRECFYDYAYTGCNWASLSCSPMVECKCENPLGSGEGTWSCKENISPSCALRRSPDLPAVGESCNPEDSLDSLHSVETRIESTEKPIESPSTPPTSSECPLNPIFGECIGYQEGLHCDFEYVYKGCTWDTLQCSPAIQCDCSEGIWNCEIDFTTPCEVTVNGHPPGGVPWGEECDPETPLVIPENIEKKAQCPDAFAFGSCAQFEEDLKCDYNYAYKGCTWDEFACAPSITCRCKQESWRCSGDFENRCGIDDESPSIPEEYPWGESCNPYNDEELQEILKMLPEAPSSEPTSAPSSAPTLAEEPTSEFSSVSTVTEVMGRLSDECPMTFRYGKCSKEYIDGLECPYTYAYKGCSWEELSCEPIIQCKCDHWFGQWECKSDFDNCSKDGVLSLPDGLPWGESCDPLADLPSPPV